jgi:DNA-binding MarR family transcriptional regulator
LDGVAEALDRLLLRARTLTPANLSATSAATLHSLAADGPQRVSALAESQGVSQPGMTTLVNRLEASGYAVRVSDPADGRAALVRITDEGRAALRERHAARAQNLLAHLDRLSEADQRALVAALPAIERLAAIRTGVLATR